ncbi:MAG: hypothetical protein V1679_02465 [Candidatus Peregrinibacteria bacterium]
MPIWIYLVIAFLVFDVVLVLVIVVRRKSVRKFRAEEAQYIKSHWIRIIDSFHNDPKNAVMDADKILDYALLRRGFEGSLGEKLKKAGPRFSDLNGVWSAHKLRNRIAHEMGNISKDEAKKALGGFKRGLNDLGAGL